MEREAERKAMTGKNIDRQELAFTGKNRQEQAVTGYNRPDVVNLIIVTLLREFVKVCGSFLFALNSSKNLRV